MARVTIAEVSKLAGVSLGTVSNMLNHPDLVRPDTKAVIQQAIDTLGYVPNRNARVLAGGKNSAFGLILSGLYHDFSAQIAQGAHDAARQMGRELLIASADNDDILQNRYLDYFQGAQMAGLLLEPRAGSSWEPRQRMGIPTVLLDVYGEPGNTCKVAADNRQAGHLAAEHVMSLGKKRIVVVTAHDDIASLSLRLEGVREGVEADANVVITQVMYADDWNSQEDGFTIGRRLAEADSGKRCDCVITMTDMLAHGIISGILSAGLSVPNDIAVMGCDGNPRAWGSPVPMTTMEPFGYEVGFTAVRLLTESIDDPEHHRHQAMVIPMHLVPRESTVGRVQILDALRC